MSTEHSLVTLNDTTATLLTPRGVHSGMDITIQNVNESAIVYLGGEGVTSTNYGYRLAVGSAWSVELPPKYALYAISDTNGAEAAVLKLGLENRL
jgi:hypothetical protein